MTGRRDHGITLIELVVAMALFALVAVMGLQALTGTLHLRDRLVETDSGNAALSLTLTLMRHDLGAMLPLLFYPPGAAPRSSLEVSQDGQVLAFSTSGQADLPPLDGGGFHRIQWRFDPARQMLLRQAWPVLYPRDSASAGPEVEYLTGVTGFALRSHWPQIGWVAGADSGLAPSAEPAGGGDSDRGAVLPESYSSALPEAVEVTIDTARFGRITLIETLK